MIKPAMDSRVASQPVRKGTRPGDGGCCESCQRDRWRHHAERCEINDEQVRRHQGQAQSA